MPWQLCWSIGSRFKEPRIKAHADRSRFALATSTNSYGVKVPVENLTCPWGHALRLNWN